MAIAKIRHPSENKVVDWTIWINKSSTYYQNTLIWYLALLKKIWRILIMQLSAPVFDVFFHHLTILSGTSKSLRKSSLLTIKLDVAYCGAILCWFSSSSCAWAINRTPCKFLIILFVDCRSVIKMSWPSIYAPGITWLRSRIFIKSFRGFSELTGSPIYIAHPILNATRYSTGPSHSISHASYESAWSSKGAGSLCFSHVGCLSWYCAPWSIPLSWSHKL